MPKNSLLVGLHALWQIVFLTALIQLAINRFGFLPESYLLLIYFLSPVYLLLNILFRTTSLNSLSYLSILLRHISAVLILLLIASVLVFSFKIFETSRIIIFSSMVLTIFINFIISAIIKSFFLVKTDFHNDALLIYKSSIDQIDFFQKKSFKKIILMDDIPFLESQIKEHKISRVYIFVPEDKLNKINDVLKLFENESVDIMWILPKLQIKNSLFSLYNPIKNAIPLSISPYNDDLNHFFVKRFIDVFLSIILIILSIPIFFITFLLIKISDGGPLFFKQKRHGLNGKIFNMYKFRSMHIHNDSMVIQAKSDDKRITRIGKILRKTSIDEIPQLINVLRGEMSLVGPRPHAVIHNYKYQSLLENYMHRHRVKPGITGLAQVNGLRGETDTIDKMKARLKYDLEYIQNWSLYLDIQILAQTPISLIKHKAH